MSSSEFPQQLLLKNGQRVSSCTPTKRDRKTYDIFPEVHLDIGINIKNEESILSDELEQEST